MLRPSFSDVITVFGDFTQEAWGTMRIHLKGSLEILQEPYVAYRWGQLPTEHGGGSARFAFVSAVNGQQVRRELAIRHPDENTVVDEVIEQRFRLDWLPTNWTVQSPDPNGQRSLFLHSTLYAIASYGGERVSFQNTAAFEQELPPGYTFTSELGFLSAVPEPHEYGLLAGAGLLGFALWRRRAKA
ncbi:MAG: PEP-CTERM sorting domain-containing protein [Verrucomicrobia bacterium]|nr:PEP-CTERM sorting domain-containing protein [Verrucomicrobiota bacterium]